MPGMLDKYSVPGAAIALIREGEVVLDQGIRFCRSVSPDPRYDRN